MQNIDVARQVLKTKTYIAVAAGLLPGPRGPDGLGEWAGDSV